MANLFWPDIKRPPRIPVHIICGPPAAGKSSFAKKHMAPGDVLIDMDEIAREVGGTPRGDEWKFRRLALEERNRRLLSLADEEDAGAAWFLTGAPSGSRRPGWARLLGSGKAMLMLTPRGVSERRIRSDPERSRQMETQFPILDKWWTR